MLISHEVPLKLLNYSRKFNDFDYCLVHLLPQYEEYYNFYKESLALNREVMLDNSIFELGTAFAADKFAEWVVKLQPTYYIIPDVLEDAEQTMQNCKHWIKNYKNLPGKIIGVVQGHDYKSIIDCYKYINSVADVIAISFGYSYYEALYPHVNKYVSWMNGRILLINKLLKDGILNINKPHHLLGCGLPQEFIYYRNMPFIRSVDTSNPIVHAIKNMPYNNWGLLDKERLKLVDLFNTSEINIELINYNVKKFKEFCGR